MPLNGNVSVIRCRSWLILFTLCFLQARCNLSFPTLLHCNRELPWEKKILYSLLALIITSIKQYVTSRWLWPNKINSKNDEYLMNNTLHNIVFQTIYIKFVNPNTCPDVLSMPVRWWILYIVLQFYKFMHFSPSLEQLNIFQNNQKHKSLKLIRAKLTA